MPRQPRVDISGLLHHVAFCGIDGGKVVKDGTVRSGFEARLGKLAEECLQRIAKILPLPRKSFTPEVVDIQ